MNRFIFAAFVLLSLVFFGCAKGKSVDNAAEKNPKTAEELTIGIYSPAGNVTTYTIGNSWNDWILWLAFDKLREPSPYSESHDNWLAESVKSLSDDNREWEIKLKKGIMWHDGTELTAEDLAFTYEYYREGPSNRWTHHMSRVPRVEDITVVDNYTVRIQSEWPMPNFDRITAADLAIIQKKQWENVTEPRKFTDLPIGTGPYKLVEYKPDEYYTFEAFEDYFMGAPLVKKINVVMIQDPQVMFTALKSGEIDGAVRHLPPELLEEWQNDSSVGVVESPSFWGVFLSLNSAREPFATKEVRRAISLLVDPKPLLETVMLNNALTGAHGFPHPEAPWTFPDLTQPTDPEKAAALFAELGYSDRDGDGFMEDPQGNPIDWEILTASNQPLYIRAAEMIKEQLAAGGFKSHLRIMDPAGVSSAVWTDFTFDMAIMDTTPHGLADQDMMIIGHQGMTKTDLHHDQEREALVDDWFHTNLSEDRFDASGAYQSYFNEYPHRVFLWYPRGYWAYRPDSYDNYAVSPGYGIFHKYSFLPEEIRGNTIIKENN